MYKPLTSEGDAGFAVADLAGDPDRRPLGVPVSCRGLLILAAEG
jgi:hypothetical protein